MRIRNLNYGAHAVLIAYLRELGGSAVVNCYALSKSNGLSRNHISTSVTKLKGLGLLTIEKQGKGPRQPTLITLNEEAIRRYESKATQTAGVAAKRASRTSSSIAAQDKFGKIHADSRKVLNSVTNYRFSDERKRKLIDPLLERTLAFLSECVNSHLQLGTLRAEILKLTEAARGLGAEDQDIEKIKTPDASETVKKADYPELLPVPIINFPEFLSEPSFFFKQLATLQARARELRNWLVEVDKELARLKQVSNGLKALVNELQSIEPVVDLSMALSDWQERSDRYFEAQVRLAIAPVASKI